MLEEDRQNPSQQEVSAKGQDIRPVKPSDSAELLTQQQRELREQLENLGVIRIIEEVTGTWVPSLSHAQDRRNHGYLAAAQFSPDGAIVLGRPWVIDVLGLRQVWNPDRNSPVVYEADDRYLATDSSPAILELQFTLRSENAGTPMYYSVAHFRYNGHGITITGEKPEFTGGVPEDSRREAVLRMALGRALTFPHEIPNPHYVR